MNANTTNNTNKILAFYGLYQVVETNTNYNVEYLVDGTTPCLFWNQPKTSEGLELAHRKARAAHWEEMMDAFHIKTMRTLNEMTKSVCKGCPFRNTTGCLGAKCPAHAVMDRCNSLKRLGERTAKSLWNDIAESDHNLLTKEA